MSLKDKRAEIILDVKDIYLEDLELIQLKITALYCSSDMDVFLYCNSYNCIFSELGIVFRKKHVSNGLVLCLSI